MKIMMSVIESKDLEKYINDGIVPFAVCPSIEGISAKQRKVLEKYYNKVTDQRGIDSYYCNIIDPYKCRDNGYDSIEFANGNKKIKGYSLEKNRQMGNKYVVTIYFGANDKTNALELTKKNRLKVANLKKKINNKNVDKSL